MRSFWMIALIFVLIVSCADDYDQESFICGNAANEYFPARQAYMDCLQEYEDLIASGEMEPEMVQGTDVGKVRWMLEDERSERFMEVLRKWNFCPYLNRPERMEEFR